MLVVAHRGANQEAQENSWTAFEKALEGGATRIELDVQVSSDGYGVILHDDELYGMTGTRGFISRMTKEDIGRLRLKNGEKIPFLSEVIAELLPKVELNIEVKGPKLQACYELFKSVRMKDWKEKILVSSFYKEPLLYLKKLDPAFKRACLVGDDGFFWGFFIKFAPHLFMEEVGAHTIHPYWRLVDEHFMDQAVSRGWTVIPWVGMNDEEGDKEFLWSSLRTFGVSGLCTNYPRQFKRWLEEVDADAKRFNVSEG